MIPEYKMDVTEAVDNGIDLGVELPDTPSVIIHYLLDGPNATQILPNWADAMLGRVSDRNRDTAGYAPDWGRGTPGP